MKRFWALLLAIAMGLSLLTGCEMDEEENTPKKKKTEEDTRSFVGTIIHIYYDDSVVVEPAEGSDECKSSDQISFSCKDLEDIGAVQGSVVEVTYTGEIAESYPAQIRAVSWELSDALQDQKYRGQWLNKQDAEKDDDDYFYQDIVIYAIYADCFFATPSAASPYKIKVNGEIAGDWCVGDQVCCTYDNVYYDYENDLVEADLASIEKGDYEPDPGMDYKPVIYLYPEKETEVLVKLTLDGSLTCTYPAYNNGWKVTAAPDGTLTDEQGQAYNYLYWEGLTYAQYDLSRGFCVKGEDTAAFLEEALEKLGLTRREANEFIVYWLPLMEQNPYNIIGFQTDIYTEAAQLEVLPAPDTMIRVFMAWRDSDVFVELPGQELTAPERTGFTVVEWGGTEID